MARRTFLAIEVPTGIREALGAALDTFREFSLPVRWVDSSSLHMTLKFLGETGDEEVESIGRGLLEVLADQRVGPCEVCEIGAFPNLARARILHARVDEPTGGLCRLVRAVEGVAGPLGFPPETRAYRAHITLGRVRGRRRPGSELNEAVLRWENHSFGTFHPAEVVHYESRLGPGGARYLPIACFPLCPVSTGAGPTRSETP